MTTGWICPRCGKALAPHVRECDHDGFGMFPTNWPLGSLPVYDTIGTPPPRDKNAVWVSAPAHTSKGN